MEPEKIRNVFFPFKKKNKNRRTINKVDVNNIIMATVTNKKTTSSNLSAHPDEYIEPTPNILN